MTVDAAPRFLDIARPEALDGDLGADLHPDNDEPSILDEPRVVSKEDRLRYEGYLAEILSALGLDLATPVLAPRRVAS
jgi:hypothetical protein